MNLLRSIFPLWSTSTSAMMVFTCSERPISRILSRRRHWKRLQKRWGEDNLRFCRIVPKGSQQLRNLFGAKKAGAFLRSFKMHNTFFCEQQQFLQFYLVEKFESLLHLGDEIFWNVLKFFVCVQSTHCFNEDLYPWGSTLNNGSHSFPLCPSEEILALSKLPVLVFGRWTQLFYIYLFVDLCKYRNLRNTAGQSDTVLRSN